MDRCITSGNRLSEDRRSHRPTIFDLRRDRLCTNRFAFPQGFGIANFRQPVFEMTCKCRVSAVEKSVSNP